VKRGGGILIECAFQRKRRRQGAGTIALAAGMPARPLLLGFTVDPQTVYRPPEADTTGEGGW
jgi:hypothetical protein